MWSLWLDPEPRPGWHNMAIDQALLDLAAGEGLAVFRLYQWKPFCLSFGRHEPALRRYGREAVERLGLDAVRRPTGGRAVWHAQELTYAAAAPLGGESLEAVYIRLHTRLLQAVRSLGADTATLATRPADLPRPADGGCFEVPVGGEVVVGGGRKVLGSAQVRSNGAYLQHGSLLLESGQEVVRSLLGQGSGASPESPLSSVVGRTISFPEAAAAVVTAFGAESWPAADPFAILSIAARHEDRFRSVAWTWER